MNLYEEVLKMESMQVSVGTGEREDAVRIPVEGQAVLFAGSRYGDVAGGVCRELIAGFGRRGCCFLVGCADGVDRSVREAVAESRYVEKCFVACAFGRREGEIRKAGLFAQVVVSPALTAKAALHRRTLWMVRRSALIILFPERPSDRRWGKGSQLVYRSALYQLKPVFVVTQRAPKVPVYYRVIKGRLFGVVEGYWAVATDGQCGDEL